MKEVVAELVVQQRYQFDESDPAFEKVNNTEIEHLVKMMMFTDVCLSTKEEDIVPLIKVTIHD